ncbi:xanthine dehydrogenase iron-sulfur-binding subunit YagT 1 [Rhizobium gallicum]|uniref:Xanthine dehydrogenase iron-sulfur-binding subunit YagT 1 n=2 Tax=Rhizobium gallicum TaxID=56730 RepID=A0A1L5NM63_9HYPH|nr:xanthine dehydrogenase iron-sulfur-binding subunit YagT 1 [Rhizobium gallicum]
MSNSAPPGVTRRQLLEGVALMSLTSAMPPVAKAQALAPGEVATAGAITGSSRLPMAFLINQRHVEVALDPRTTLLDALRNEIGLPGSKKGCDHGQCGACTVLIDGRRINACLTLAIMHQDDEITTIEGLSDGEGLHPMQAAFVARDGFQCGYCTPGQICSAVGMLQEAGAGWPSHASDDVARSQFALSDEEIRERMSGNLCRCAAYPNIVAAIRDVAERG